jgi:hypothetical protein
MDDIDYKETDMAELNMNEFVSHNITLQRIVSDGRMKFKVIAGRNRYGLNTEYEHDTELAAKQDFMTRVRETLALPEGTY